MHIRVALNIHEPLKKNMVFEKEDETVVNDSFKYEKVGVFYFICGLLGHTDNVCRKRVEPGFIDSLQGWGKFLNAGSRTIGGSIIVNKCSCGGRMVGRGGVDGGRGGVGNTNGAGENADNTSSLCPLVRVFFRLIVLNLVDFSLCEGSDEICFLQTGLILFLWCITLA